MNTTSSSPPIVAPHRRNRGTRTSTPANVSTIPSTSAAARLSCSGTLAWASRTAAAGASVIFQRPATRNSADVSTAAATPTQVFQPASSKRASASAGCAILSSMNLILALFTGLMGAQMADLAITGARIYTEDQRNPVVSAIAAKSGKIVAIGDDVSAYIGPSTRKIDAKGATIIPGLIDSHVHMQGLGESLEILDLRAAKSAETIAGMVREEAARRKPGEWI